MILPSMYGVIEPLASFGLSANNDGVIIGVVAPFGAATQSPAALAGLEPGQRIDLRRMQCRNPTSGPCTSLVAVLGGLGGMQYALPDREIDLVILPEHAGPSRTVHLRSAPAPLDWPTRLVLLANTVVGVLFVLAAAWLVWTRPSRMTWGFFLYAAWFNPGQTYAYYAVLHPWPIAVLVQQFAEALMQGAGYAGLLAFALRFPVATIDPHWPNAEKMLPWVGAVITLLMLLSGANLFGFHTEKVTEAALLSGYAVNAAVICVLLLRRRRLAPQDRERMRWAIAGCVIGLPAFIFASLCQSSSLPQDLLGGSPPQAAVGLLYLLHGALAYFVCVSVRQRRVVSVAIPLRHGTLTVALTLALGVPIVYLHELVATYQETLHLPEWIWPLVVAPVVLVVFQRLHEIAVDLADHVFNRRFHRAQHRLGHAGKAMLEAGSFAEIDRLLVEAPVDGLGLSSAAVFRSIDGMFRRTEPAIGWSAAGQRELHPDRDELALRSLALGAPVRLPRAHANLPDDDLAPCLAVPVCGGASEGIAVALFGAHESGSDIDGDERGMLQTLAVRAAAAYDRVETELLRREVREMRARLAAFQGAAGRL